MNIPVELKIITIVVIFLVILLIIALKRKQRRLVFPIIIVIILTIAFGAWKGLSEYTRTNKDLGTVKADINISAIELLKDYETNDSVANFKYLGKVIEVNGNVKKIEQDEKEYYTLVLGDSSALSSVRCSMDTVHSADAAQLSVGSSVSVRGACTGFNKDEMGLGSDVILNRCVIIRKNQ